MAEGTSPSPATRWFARLAWLTGIAAVIVLLVGGLKSVGALVVLLGGLAVVLAAGWWFLSTRGALRWLAAALAAVAPIVVLAVFISRGLLWEVLVAIALVVVTVGAARRALAATAPSNAMPEHPATPPQHPYVIMNPRSGGGKVGRFALDEKATAKGAEVALLDGPGQVDVAALARDAVDAGADLLGVAGGDGTQALVAGIAAEHDLPFLVVCAGTRNHFALDLGLDREHPDASLDGLTDAVELQLDLGMIGDRVFVNNASFGAYADIVQRPEYRDDKRGTTLKLLPDLLAGQGGARLVVRIDGEETIEAPKAVLVSNNPYETGDPAGLGRRARLDTGRLGVVAVTVDNAAQAVGLLRGGAAKGLTAMTAREVVVDSDAAEIPVGIDGEAVMMPTPVRCTIRPLALRVRVPRQRPGVPQQKPPIDRALLHHDVATLARLAAPGHTSVNGHPDR